MSFPRCPGTEQGPAITAGSGFVELNDREGVMLEISTRDPQSSSTEEEGGGEEGSCGMLLRDHRERASVSRPVCLLTFVGSSPGPLCEQHLGVRERHVPRQPLRPVLFPARLSPDADSHRRGPPPGEGTHPRRPVLPSPALLSKGLKAVF